MVEFLPSMGTTIAARVIKDRIPALITEGHQREQWSPKDRTPITLNPNLGWNHYYY